MGNMNVNCKLITFQINSNITRQKDSTIIRAFSIRAGTLIKMCLSTTGTSDVPLLQASMPALSPTWHTTYLFTYLLTYLLTPQSRDVPEKLTGFKLFPEFYATRRFIIAFASVCHLSQSKPTSSNPYSHIPLPEDPSLYFPPIYVWVSEVVSYLQVSPPKPCIFLSSPNTCYMPHPSHSSPIDHPNNIG
jgi:hypothetical protein